MRQMRKTQNQMAVLLNEYGGVEGVVTLEDLLEEIVGEIDDETDIAEEEVFKNWRKPLCRARENDSKRLQ